VRPSRETVEPHYARGVPAPISDAVSAAMSRMPRADSAPEVALRRELHARGLRFRKHVRGLAGRPDIVFTRARLAVFCDGCFWHRCPVHGTAPKNNADWWQAKFQANVERDRRQTAQLEAAGWTVLRVWEHEGATEGADRVAAVYRALVSAM
jgi:DNA mismatch endonuclease (patch repair protein)